MTSAKGRSESNAFMTGYLVTGYYAAASGGHNPGGPRPDYETEPDAIYDVQNNP